MSTHLGRNDEINLFDASGTLVDRLTYGDQNYAGTVRTQSRSCSIPASDYSYTVAQPTWVLAAVGDSYKAKLSTRGEVGSPGYVVPHTLADLNCDGDVDEGDLAVMEACRTGPVCEGQISGLTQGTYVLKLRPCSGNNVLRGDKDLSVGQPAFAVKADQVTGDEIAFTVRPPCPADFDADGDVDLSDFGFFQMCFNGPNRPAPYAECDVADFDDDNDVDLTDFGTFQGCFNGPNRPPACE